MCILHAIACGTASSSLMCHKAVERKILHISSTTELMFIFMAGLLDSSCSLSVLLTPHSYVCTVAI